MRPRGEGTPGTGEQVKQEITEVAGVVKETAGKVVGSEHLEEAGHEQREDAAAKAADEEAHHEARHLGDGELTRVGHGAGCAAG